MIYTPSAASDIDVAVGRAPYENVIVIGKRLGVTVVEEDIWNVGGTRSLTAAANAASIVSTSASDAAAGTGARTVLISGLAETTFARDSEIVTMNGTTAVTTVKRFAWIQQAAILTAGSGTNAAGTITVSLSGSTQGQILAGEASTFATHYMVPAGYTAFAWKVLFSLSGKRNLTINGALKTFEGVVHAGLKFFLVEQPFEISLKGAFVARQKQIVWTKALVEVGVSDVQTTVIWRIVPNGYVSPAISG